MREFWKNGFLNKLRSRPPKPSFWDSYYYYSDNMDKITVPFISFLADSEGDLLDLVDADQIIRDFMNGKTEHDNDIHHMIP